MEDKRWSDDRNYRDARGFSGFIWWDGALGADRIMSDFLRFMTDLIHLRRAQPALKGNGARVTRVNNLERVIILHRWIEGEGKDVVVIASLDENPKWNYPVGLPLTGKWNEILNSHYYWNFPNPGTIGNGGSIQAFGPPMDQFSTSATINVPPNGILIFSYA